jgi:hypothetical protein
MTINIKIDACVSKTFLLLKVRYVSVRIMTNFNVFLYFLNKKSRYHELLDNVALRMSLAEGGKPSWVNANWQEKKPVKYGVCFLKRILII